MRRHSGNNRARRERKTQQAEAKRQAKATEEHERAKEKSRLLDTLEGAHFDAVRANRKLEVRELQDARYSEDPKAVGVTLKRHDREPMHTTVFLAAGIGPRSVAKSRVRQPHDNACGIEGGPGDVVHRQRLRRANERNRLVSNSRREEARLIAQHESAHRHRRSSHPACAGVTRVCLSPASLFGVALPERNRDARWPARRSRLQPPRRRFNLRRRPKFRCPI